MNNLPVSQALPDLLPVLQRVAFFSHLDESSLKELIPELEQSSLLPGDILFHRGEPGDRLYILVAGKLHLIQTGAGSVEQPVAEINPGQSIGEIFLITGEIYPFTARAVEACRLLSLDRSGLGRIASRSPEVESRIVASIQRSFYASQLEQLLEESNIFGSLDPAVLSDLQAEFTFQSLKGGQVFMQQGDPSDSLYLVISGRLGVFITAAGGEKTVLIEIGRGQTVGEMGLITHEPRSAGVYALRDSLLARLSIESFERLLARYPKDIMEHFAGSSITRLTQQIQGKVTPQNVAISIAIHPAHGGIPVHEFSSRLAQALQKIGTTLHVNSQLCDDQLNWKGVAQASAEDPGHTRLVLWLSEQEAAHQYVIYEADPAPSAWTERCLRQADRVLLLRMQGASQVEGMRLPEIDETQASLVLLYEEGEGHPTGTQAALDLHGLKEQYKVRIHRSADYARLARLLTGKGTGLVLSGGGARTLAQIGVLRALNEAGYEIDAVGGVSAGALCAALFAIGLTPEESIRKIRDEIRPVDYTLPVHSLVSGKNWTSGLQALLGGWNIDDLWLDYFCLSANLTQSSMHIHRSGSLFQAVRASTSIPGILPPVSFEGDILVDGGLINNFPADILRTDPRIGTVIGIDVAQVHERAPASFGYHVSGWKSLLARFLPFVQAPAIPNILEILSESMTISKSQSQSSNRSLVDLYLCPPTEGFNLMDFHKVEAIAEVGYQYARRMIG